MNETKWQRCIALVILLGTGCSSTVIGGGDGTGGTSGTAASGSTGATSSTATTGGTGASGSTSGTGGNGSTSGAGGTTGGVGGSCSTVADCPVNEGCMVPTSCDAGVCVFNYAPLGQSCGANGTCNGKGRCSVILAMGQNLPWEIAVNATGVYWLDSPTGSSNGMVLKCGIDGCNLQPTILAAQQAAPFRISLGATKVYWSNVGVNGFGTDGSIRECNHGGCGQSPTVIKGDINVYAFVTDSNNAYWTSSGNGTGEVWTCALSGCVPEKLADVQGLPSDIAVHGTVLAWVAGGGFMGAVWKCDPSGCMPEPLASGPTLAVGAMAMDATNVYFTNGGSIMKCAIAGCNGNPIPLVQGLNGSAVIATDGTDVYFDNSVMGGGGSLLKCAVDGCNGSPTVITEEPAVFSPGGIAVDATSVYWTDYNHGTVMKISK